MNMNPYMMEQFAKLRMDELMGAADCHRFVRRSTEHPHRPDRRAGLRPPVLGHLAHYPLPAGRAGDYEAASR